MTATGLRKAGWLVGLYLLAVLFLNWTYHFSSDDCSYALGCLPGTDGLRAPLGTFANAWRANGHDGYRPIVHLFVRTFTGCFDKWVFNLANTVLMAALVFCILRLAKRTAAGFNAVALTLALVFFVLCKGESYLWCAGSVNYLWAGTGSLAFCLILERLACADDSWALTAVWCLLALFAGWLQEAFALPIGFALCACLVLRRKAVTVKKLAVLLFYAIGVVLLVRIAGRRASTIPPFALTTLLMTMLKIAVAVKAVWILAVMFLLNKEKKAFVARNLFDLLVIGASVGMVALVGFNGERSLWAANLFAIVVLVRECRPSDRIANGLAIALVATLGVCCWLGYRIKGEFDDFTNAYRASENGLCWHNRVPCGPFARFFHQSIYTWEDGGHGEAYARFQGGAVAPAALSKSDYDALVSGTFCTRANRLPIDADAYTRPDSNTIIVPLSESSPAPRAVHVTYDFPKGLTAQIAREIAMRRNPPVSPPDVPRVVCINGRRFAFISKMPGSDPYIRGVSLSDGK